MVNDKDNSITSKCSVCGQMFPNIQSCLKHELLSHHLQKKNKVCSSIHKRLNEATRFLNSTEKSDERDQLEKHLEKTKKGEELETIFKLFCMKTENLGLIFTRIQTSLEIMFIPDEVKVYAFGSIASGLALRDCDVDIFLDASKLQLSPNHNTYDQKDQQRAAFNRISKLLYRSPHFTNVLPVRKARVPIIKCKHKDTGFSIDINISYPSSRENTQFICDLVHSDNRIHELMLFLKLWAKNMQIISRANMTSYCLIMMVIFFLQQPRKPLNDSPKLNNKMCILKSIKKLQDNCPFHIVQGINYAYNLNRKENIPKIPTAVSTWDLIKEFFSFYKDFKFGDFIISPYYGKAIEKKNLTPDICEEYYKQMRTITQYLDGDKANDLQIDRCMCVQDAFCLNHNIAKSVTPQSKQYFIFCLENAHKICENSNNLKIAELYVQLLFETQQMNTSTTIGLPKLQVKVENVENNSNKLVHTIRPSKADLRILFADYIETNTHVALHKWCQHYIEAIETILIKLYRMDIQKQIPAQHKQAKLDNVADNVLNRSWLISCTVDLWTNRQFQKQKQTSFMEYQLEQTKRLHNLRRQDPKFSMSLNAILKLTVLSNFMGIDLQLDLPEETPISNLNKKSPLRKFFNMFKNTLQNYNLKEALQNETTGNCGDSFEASILDDSSYTHTMNMEK